MPYLSFVFCTILGIAVALDAVSPCVAQEKAAQDRGGDPPQPPLFTRHVAALFSKLGCNGGACHGAVKGQNGFRLSLFGADPSLDHERLLREAGGRRVNLQTPEASLLLLKATGRISHGGGKRVEVGSDDYEILRRWVAAGAKLDPPEKSASSSCGSRPPNSPLML